MMLFMGRNATGVNMCAWSGIPHHYDSAENQSKHKQQLFKIALEQPTF
jgi:hypothetical protein